MKKFTLKDVAAIGFYLVLPMAIVWITRILQVAEAKSQFVTSIVSMMKSIILINTNDLSVLHLDWIPWEAIQKVHQRKKYLRNKKFRQ